MTLNRMIELLEIEHECVLRNSHDDCNRNCIDCDIVQDDDELHEMYTNVIGIMKGLYKITEVFSQRFCIPCDLCKRFLGNGQDCPEEVERCNGKRHWEKLMERIMNDEENEV